MTQSVLLAFKKLNKPLWPLEVAANPKHLSYKFVFDNWFSSQYLILVHKYLLNNFLKYFYVCIIYFIVVKNLTGISVLRRLITKNFKIFNHITCTTAQNKFNNSIQKRQSINLFFWAN